jgi:L-ascorbate metabolism protein UlaG (beta-lactamase superfamily)
MKINKLGHCCLLIKEKNLTILTDPGSYTTAQNDITGIKVILITHEHQDHFHLDSLKTVLKNNPDAKIITNRSVGTLLDNEKIPYKIVEEGQEVIIDGVKIEGLGEKHEEIYREFGQVQNTGFMISNYFFYPGDAFHDPERPVHVLALPVAGPWCKISDAVDYALRLKPKKVFPVHDGNLISPGVTYRVPDKYLKEAGIEFAALELNQETEF